MKPDPLLDVGPVASSTASPRSPARRQSLSGLAILLLPLVLFLAFLSPALAGDGDLDPSFDPGVGVQQLPGMRDRINYTDGTNRFLIYGFFTSINGVARGSLARFSSTGVLDTTFNPPISGEVRRVVLLTNGQILVGGRITVGSGGNTYYNLARLNADGTVDPTFTKTFNDSGILNAIRVQSDGKLLVGGWSLQVVGDSTAAYHLLRLNNNGSVDPSYLKRSAPEGLVNGICILTGDQARIYGTLPNISGTHTGYLTLLDNTGALVSYLGDETFNGTVYNFATQSDGKKVYVGQFSQVLGVARKHIARLNNDGTLDTSFDPGVGPNGRVNNIAIQTDGKIVVAGNFNTFNGNSVGYIVRLNTNGTVDNTFVGTADARIQVMVAVPGTTSDLIAFGWFKNFNGIARPGIAYMDSNGNLTGYYSGWTSANTNAAIVYALAAQGDGKVWVGGDFTGVGGQFRRGLARLNPDGTLDTSTNSGVDGYVKSLAVQGDGKLLAGGYFGEANGFARTSLARFNADANASLDKAFNPIVTTQDGEVAHLAQVAPLPNGMMITGDFSNVHGSNRNAVARLNSDGSLDAAFNFQLTLPGTDIRGTRVAPVGDKYLILGSYLLGGSTLTGFLTRLQSNGGSDPTFGPNPPTNCVIGMDLPPSDMFLQPDGNIMICGAFTQIYTGSAPPPPARSGIARITAGGTLDNTFIPIITGNPIMALASQPHNKVLMGGFFTVPYSGVARLNADGSLDATFNPGSGTAFLPVFSILGLDNGKALLGGWFNTYNGVSRPGIARIFAVAPKSDAGVSLLLLGN